MSSDPRTAATEALARCWNRLDPQLLAPWLAECVRYTSSDTDLHLEGRAAVLDHLERKAALIEQVGDAARLHAELGLVGSPQQPCVIASQGDRGPSALFLVWVDGEGLISRVEVTTRDPDPRSALPSGVRPD